MAQQNITYFCTPLTMLCVFSTVLLLLSNLWLCTRQIRLFTSMLTISQLFSYIFFSICIVNRHCHLTDFAVLEKMYKILKKHDFHGRCHVPDMHLSKMLKGIFFVIHNKSGNTMESCKPFVSNFNHNVLRCASHVFDF